MRKYRGAAASAVSPARIQLQRRRIDAIAQAGRLRPIRKHVAEMCVTARAQYLHAAHAVRAVLARNHCFIRGRIEEARRSEEHTSELQSLIRTSYAVFCSKT